MMQAVHIHICMQKSKTDVQTEKQELSALFSEAMCCCNAVKQMDIVDRV